MFLQTIDILYDYIQCKEYSLLMTVSKTLRTHILENVSFNTKAYFELTSYKRFLENSEGLSWRICERVGDNCALEFQILPHSSHFVVAHRPRDTRLFTIPCMPGAELGEGATFSDSILLSRVFYNKLDYGRIMCEETLTLQTPSLRVRSLQKVLIQISLNFDLNTKQITATAVYFTHGKVTPRRTLKRGHFACHRFVDTDVVRIVKKIRNYATTPVDILAGLFTSTLICWYH
jgi:hypothetical protein